MKALNHPNVVQLFEAINTKIILFIIMEHISGGNMLDYLKEDHGHMAESKAETSSDS